MRLALAIFFVACFFYIFLPTTVFEVYVMLTPFLVYKWWPKPKNRLHLNIEHSGKFTLLAPDMVELSKTSECSTQCCQKIQPAYGTYSLSRYSKVSPFGFYLILLPHAFFTDLYKQPYLLVREHEPVKLFIGIWQLKKRERAAIARLVYWFSG